MLRFVHVEQFFSIAANLVTVSLKQSRIKKNLTASVEIITNFGAKRSIPNKQRYFIFEINDFLHRKT